MVTVYRFYFVNILTLCMEIVYMDYMQCVSFPLFFEGC